MKKALFLSYFLFFFFCVMPPAFSLLGDLEAGDRFFEESRFSEAVPFYEKALEENPKDYEAAWRLARTYSKWGWGLSKKERKSKKEILEKAVYYARLAIEIENDGFEGHLFLAEGLGMLSDFVGSEAKVRFSREIKKEVERAIELDPSNYKPYMILGTWHRKVEEASWIEKEIARAFFGGLPDSSLADAERNLKRSVELRPDFIKNRYELALVYKALGNKDLAREELEKAIDCPISNKNEEEIKEEVTLLLKSLRSDNEGHNPGCRRGEPNKKALSR